MTHSKDPCKDTCSPMAWALNFTIKYHDIMNIISMHDFILQL